MIKSFLFIYTQGDNIIMHIILIGLVLFLLGIEGGKKGLENMVSIHLKNYIKSFNANFFLSVLIGIIITSILQSSSAVTVLLISLLDVNLIKFKTALGIVMGANIGTTITIQIISLPILDIYPYMIYSGIFFMITGILLRKKLWNIGLFIFSFGIVFYGLELMTGFFNQLSFQEIIKELLFLGANTPLKGVFWGLITTAIIQSSSAVTAILISLAKNNLITLSTAIAIALGSNIGTCITAFLASVSTGKESKRLALGHLFFNLTGVLILLPFIGFFIEFIKLTTSDLSRQIANAHTFFNIFNLLIFLPFTDTFVSFLRRK
jgi:phosphate:Na+ symporter